MPIRRIEHLFNVKALKEDLRKLGINFISAGVIGLAINHITDVTWLISRVSVLITMLGLVALAVLGLQRKIEMNTFFTIFGYSLITIFTALAGSVIIVDAREKKKGLANINDLIVTYTINKSPETNFSILKTPSPPLVMSFEFPLLHA